ncbi:MAG: glycoside hydrolase family 3 C-terminal domain-containing protein [Oscillospiraceae bacterium]|nr:glycoside hydrolase family 3 C-terminal domain-containing protein [Oscillospiraceae bacterium]
MTEKELKELLHSMSLQEKLGEMTQMAPNFFGTSDSVDLTGPMKAMNLKPEDVAYLGSTLNAFGAEKLIAMQKEHMERQPHHIPLIFMADVIHGLKTIYPVPLAMGCSFDTGLMEESAAMAARESAATGIHLTFSPMADLVRDPRWGRVTESPGEDPLLNARMTAATVKGYQGDDISAPDRIASCFKHFGGYGASEGGRDYNTVDVSDGVLREYYLTAYKAAVDAGAAMAMTSFNTIDRVPATGNKKMFRKILREEWGFDGVAITDFDAVGELIPHGLAADGKDAAEYALKAGADIEMMSTNYLNHARELIEEGKVDLSLIDEAVWRILLLKNKLGLFENPFKGADPEKEKALHLCPEHLALARKAGSKCVVLLKNEENLLPLKKGVKVGLAGPFADSTSVLGGWAFADSSDRATLKSGLLEDGVEISAMAMTEELGSMQHGIMDVSDQTAELDALADCDVVIAAVGEHPDDTGESASKTILRLSHNQEKMLEKLHDMGKKVIAIVFSGRPLELRPVVPFCDAVVQAWFLGVEAGPAIADVLTGTVNPSARLSMSFPQTVGQIPVYYNHMNTGRPLEGPYHRFVSGYLDCPNEPLYPFGYGLSYSDYRYSGFTVRTVKNAEDGTLAEVSVDVENVSDVPGRETVQLYIRDVAASVVRPVKELKDFVQIDLGAHEKKTVVFKVTREMLSFWNNEAVVFEHGDFDLMAGHSSEEVLKERVAL